MHLVITTIHQIDVFNSVCLDTVQFFSTEVEFIAYCYGGKHSRTTYGRFRILCPREKSVSRECIKHESVFTVNIVGSKL